MPATRVDAGASVEGRYGGPALKRKEARFITACGVGNSVLRDGLLLKKIFLGRLRRGAPTAASRKPTALSKAPCLMEKSA